MPVEFDISISGSNGSKYLYRSNRHKSTALTPNGDVAISPKIKMESNKASSLEFIITPANECYDDIEKKKTMVYMRRDGKYIFRGRVSDVKVDIFMQKTITCESDLSFLSDSVQPPNKSTKTESVQNTKKKKRNTLYYSAMSSSHGSSKDNIKMSVKNYFTSLINEHNNQMTDAVKHFTVGTVNIDEANSVETFERTSFQDTSSVINSDLLSVYGGILQTRYTGDTVYIDWLKDYDDVCDQQIRFGVNLIELDQESPNDSEWSVLLPVGDENITIESVNSGSKYLESSSAVQKYGRIVHYHKFNNAKKPAELLAKAQKYMAVHGKVFPDSIIVKAIDLQLIDGESTPLELGEKIKVLSSPHGINKTMSCIAMELDIENPENNSYTIGVIMPPDKEKKKDTLSSKHSSSSKRSSGGIGSNRNAIEGLQEDVNVNSNNINVNAENIAVNALNIAVNAENIAVVAKNIAIAADTIDIKAQQITKTFGDEADDLYGYIQESAEGIKTHFADKTSGLSSDISIKAGEIKSAIQNADQTIGSSIQQTEDNITLEVHNQVEGAKAEIKVTTDTIESTVAGKVGKDEVISRINQTAEKITIQASKIDLSGYVTASQLSTTDANIANLVNGNTVASKIYATDLKAVTGRLDIGDSGNSAKLYYHGTEYYDLTVSMPGVTGSFNTLGNYYKNSAYQSSISLAHSHLVSTGNDGTITIGGSVATDADASLRSFKIADTKAYKDGVSAATAAVTVGVPVRNPDVNDGKDLYDTNTHDTIIYIRATASNGNHSSANFTVSGTKAHTAGQKSVKITSVGFNTTDYTGEGVGDNQNTSFVMWYDKDSSDHLTHVRLRANANNSEHREATIDVPGNKAYNFGYSDGYGKVTVNAPYRNPNVNNGYDSYNSDTHDTTIYIRATASNGQYNTDSFTVSGSSAYNAGRSKAYEQIRDGVSVTQVTVYADGTAKATIKLTNPSNNHSETVSRTAESVRDYHV